MTIKIIIKNNTPIPYLFHNELIDVYPQTVTFREIEFWTENLRTILDFDLLRQEKGQSIENLSLKEITDFLVRSPDLKLGKLAKSIERNGVRDPLIILEDGCLLDGNRRFFACSYIFHMLTKDSMPNVLKKIPVLIIKNKDITDQKKQKILAEANFIDNLKVQWPLAVRAKVINEFYHRYEKKLQNNVYEEIVNIFGVEKKDVDAYVETVALTEEYIASSHAKNEYKFRQQVQRNFVYFWEFRNKATKGNGALDPENELPKVKKLFSHMIKNERFDSLKQIEPMIKAVRDPYRWKQLTESKGTKIAQIEALYKEKKAIRSSEDKVRNFLKWLQETAEPDLFTSATHALLKNINVKCADIFQKEE